MNRTRKVLSLFLAILMMTSTLAPLAYAQPGDFVMSQDVQDQGTKEEPTQPTEADEGPASEPPGEVKEAPAEEVPDSQEKAPAEEVPDSQ